MAGSELDLEQARRRLYEIVRGDVSFEQMTREVLELGVRYLGVDRAHLTRIDIEISHWEVMVSTDPADGRYPVGMEADLSGTYCRKAIESDASLDIYDAGEEGLNDDPAYEEHGLHCYLGTRLLVDNEPYGTLCFVGDDPREEFTEAETWFSELAARLLEREIENQQHEARLQRQSNLALVLNRVLRHNVRNDMAVIRGYTHELLKNIDNEDGEVALRHIDRLLELTEKARTLDDIVASDFERSHVDVVSMVENVVEDVAERYPDASFEVRHEDEVSAMLYPSFARAVKELVENAAKHCGPSPEIEVSIVLTPNQFEVQVDDDGPGLSEQEMKVLEGGGETPLVHSSGLGLWIAHWVASSHLGSLEAELSEGTTLTLKMPRTFATDSMELVPRLTRGYGIYEAAFENASDAMVVIDDTPRILESNEAAEAVYGASREELLGREITDFLPEDYDFESAWKGFLDDGGRRETVTIEGDDGVERQVEYSASADIAPGQHLVIGRLADGHVG